MIDLKVFSKLFLVSISLLFIIGCSPQATAGKGSAEESMKTAVPKCIEKLIRQYQREPKQNPPRKVIQYLFEEKTVYYVPAICCDFYSDLYDSDCKLLGHPDGGFTGQGDGSIKDFTKNAKEVKVIWEDKR